MKLLVVCQYYYPEPSRLSDLCEGLVQRGHSVTVLTGVPNYPMGKIYDGYRHGKRRRETINGVNVIRCATFPRGRGAFARLVNYFSYPVSAWFKAGKLEADFDAVFINQQSPVMMAWPGIRYKKKNDKKAVLYCMDLWPASLTAGGLKEGSVIYRWFRRISKKVYRRVDNILVTSRLFSGYLRNTFSISEDKIEYLPQYAEDIFANISGAEHDGPIRITFAGNIGSAQSPDTIIEAARLLRGEPVEFHIAGGGKELPRIREKAKDLPNVVFYGQRPVDEMPALYAAADAMLVTLQKDPVLSLTLPGKVQSYMAAGKPIIAAADGETKTVIDAADCGYCGPAEDARALADNIRRFMIEGSKRDLGENSRLYYEEHFTRNRFMDKLEKELKGNIK